MRGGHGGARGFARRGWAAIAVTGMLLLTGCVGDAGGSGGASAAPSSPQPSVTPTPTPPAEAVVPFGGDCANVVADPASILGGEAIASPLVGPDPIRTLGGIGCDWYDSTGASLTVYVVPETEVPTGLVGRYPAGACESAYDAYVCHISGTQEGMWAMVTMPASAGSDTPPTVLASVLDGVLDGVASWPIGVPAERTDDWWDPVDCANLGAVIDVTALMQGTEFYEGYPTGWGSHPISEVIEQAGVSEWCPWYSYELGGIWLTVYPGAGFQWDLVEGTPVTVAGAESAVATVVYDTSLVMATDGTNIVTVQEAPVPLEELAAKVIAALGR